MYVINKSVLTLHALCYNNRHSKLQTDLSYFLSINTSEFKTSLIKQLKELFFLEFHSFFIMNNLSLSFHYFNQLNV